MYDNLKYNDDDYQTKSLDNLLDDYRIVNDRLVKDIIHFEQVPEKDRPYPKAKGIMALAGSFKSIVDKKDVDQEYHGIIRAYRISDGKDFAFKFTDGALISVTEVKDGT